MPSVAGFQKREAFLKQMDVVVPWGDSVKLIEPHYYSKTRGQRPVPIETMLRMYLLQVWFHLVRRRRLPRGGEPTRVDIALGEGHCSAVG